MVIHVKARQREAEGANARGIAKFVRVLTTPKNMPRSSFQSHTSPKTRISCSAYCRPSFSVSAYFFSGNFCWTTNTSETRRCCCANVWTGGGCEHWYRRQSLCQEHAATQPSLLSVTWMLLPSCSLPKKRYEIDRFHVALDIILHQQANRNETRSDTSHSQYYEYVIWMDGDATSVNTMLSIQHQILSHFDQEKQVGMLVSRRYDLFEIPQSEGDHKCNNTFFWRGLQHQFWCVCGPL
jgi:hypothetical protein